MAPLLASRIRADRSFERIYRRYAGDVYRYALAVSRNSADAEDITQTTFLNAYRAVQRGEEPRAPKNWLLAIAHNVLRQRFRQQARRLDEVELDDNAGATVPDEEGYSAAEIRRALGELAFNQRAALVMRELEGRSYAEIAEILGVSVSAVETLIFRARRALREQLETSITCHEAERSISLQLDGRLPRAEKGALRAHLRTCSECATFARSQRAQRAALRSLAAIPLPTSLTSLFGGGAGVGGAIATKIAVAGAAGVLVAGGSIEAARELRSAPAARAAPRSARADSAAIAATRATTAQPSFAVAWASLRTAARVRARATLPNRPARRNRARHVVSKASPPSAGATKRANPTPPVRARGRAGAPGQLKPKPKTNPSTVSHAPAARARPARPSRPATPARGTPPIRAAGRAHAQAEHGQPQVQAKASPPKARPAPAAASPLSATPLPPVPVEPPAGRRPGRGKR